jgi:hypothetical protein
MGWMEAVYTNPQSIKVDIADFPKYCYWKKTVFEKSAIRMCKNTLIVYTYNR